MASKKQALTWAVQIAEVENTKINQYDVMSLSRYDISISCILYIYTYHVYIYISFIYFIYIYVCFACTLCWSLVRIPGVESFQRGSGLLPPVLMFLLWTRPTLELLTAAWLQKGVQESWFALYYIVVIVNLLTYWQLSLIRSLHVYLFNRHCYLTSVSSCGRKPFKLVQTT